MHHRVLVVFPHPDDETFASAGTIALHVQAGTKVTYLCGTRGEMGRNMGRPFFANRETLPHLREEELREACRILGCDLRLMGLRDKTIEFMDPAEVAAQVGQVITDLNPSLVITYHPRWGVHPDHNALGAATIRAVGNMAPERRPEVHVVVVDPKGREVLPPPNVVVDITSVKETKMAAIRAHRSQSGQLFVRLETDPEYRARMEERMFLRESYWVHTF